MPDIDARVLEECVNAFNESPGGLYCGVRDAIKRYLSLTTTQQQGEKEPMSDCNHDDMPEQPGTGDYAEDHFWFRAKAIRIGLERALNNGVGFELEKHIAFEFQRIHNESAARLAAAEKALAEIDRFRNANNLEGMLRALDAALAAYPPTPQTETQGEKQ